MALSYVPVDRDQQYLLPPDVREWLPAGHLAWFVLDVVARVDVSVLHARHPNDGVGRRAYDPEMLLALLIYAYCTGQRSSRQIERLCEVDVAYRVVCANHVPDHTTIARFRQAHEAIAVGLFVDVLGLCAAAGLARVGVVAVDGTKMAASASLKANRDRDQVEAEVARIFADAAAVDDAEDRLFGDARGDELPDELVDPRRRAARLDAALAELNARAEASAAADAAAAAARAMAVAAAAERGHRPRGRIPHGPAGLAEARARLAGSEAEDAERAERWEQRGRRGRRPGDSHRTKRARGVLARAQARAAADAETTETAPRVNVTDPDSRVMQKADGAWVQGYNAQAAVNTSGVVIAAEAAQDPGDSAQCVPMMAAVAVMCGAAGIGEEVGAFLFDAGYCSAANLTAPGPDRLIATANTHKLRRAARAEGWVTGPPPPDAGPVEQMAHRLRTPGGAALYQLRQHTVEPVFSDVKDGRGFRRFMRRGREAVDAEWKLMMTTLNIRKLHRCGISLA
jgi:transposase